MKGKFQKKAPIFWKKVLALDYWIRVEVKAETNVKAKSLRQFVADNRSKKVYRISMNDYQQEDWVTNLPLYAVNGLEF